MHKEGPETIHQQIWANFYIGIGDDNSNLFLIKLLNITFQIYLILNAL